MHREPQPCCIVQPGCGVPSGSAGLPQSLVNAPVKLQPATLRLGGVTCTTPALPGAQHTRTHANALERARAHTLTHARTHTHARTRTHMHTQTQTRTNADTNTGTNINHPRAAAPDPPALPTPRWLTHSDVKPLHAPQSNRAAPHLRPRPLRRGPVSAQRVQRQLAWVGCTEGNARRRFRRSRRPCRFRRSPRRSSPQIAAHALACRHAFTAVLCESSV